MGRSKRLHIPGGIHYLILRGNAGRPVFPQPGDLGTFAALVEKHIGACHLRVFAFCWVTDAAHLVLQVASVPLGSFVRRVAGQYAQRINRRAGVRGHVFRQRYRAASLEEPHLPEAVRHVHLLPLSLGLAADPSEYVWSSHRSYLGIERVPWVTTETVLGALARVGRSGSDAYRQFIQDEIDRRTALVAREGGSAADEEREFLARLLPVKARRSADPGALDGLLDAIAARLNVAPDDLRSRSRRRILSLGRAVVAWHSTQSGIARLSEVARRLNRQPSTLSIGMDRYRHRRPDLFDVPIASLLARAAPER